MTQQGERQASARALSGFATASNYNEDFLRLFDAAGIPDGTFNERQLRWINGRMATSYTNLDEAMQAYATGQGAYNWSSMGALENTVNLTQAMPFNSAYSRTGPASGQTSAGLIQSFAADAPQRTNRGLALEPAATNVMLRSSEFGDAAWTKSNATVTSNAIAAPDGTLTADKIEASSAAGTSVSQLVAGAGSGSGNTFTVFAKKGTGATVANAFLLRNDTTATSILRVRLNYDTGAITYEVGTTGVTAQSLADGWWRITLATPTGFSAGNGVRCFAGWFGSAVPIGQFAYFWGAQLETGSVGTSYIPTAGTSVARGLPVFTEPVPDARTKALLTYADATTTLVPGQTPGGTFDYVTPILAASKGRVGSSELVSRTWQP